LNRKIKIVTIIVMILCVGLAYFALYTVKEDEYVIVTRFGNPTRVISKPGLQLKWPGFIEKVNRIDRRINVFVTLPIQLLLGDKNPIIVTCYIAWRVSDPLRFIQSLTFVENARQKLADMVTSQLGSALGDFTLDNIINTVPDMVKLTGIEESITLNCNARTTQEYGVEVIRMGFRRINYPSIVAEAVYNRMRAEREKEAKKFRAEGAEAASKIEAETDREVSELLAKAYKESEIIKGEGDREAMRIYAEAYGQDRDFFAFKKSLETYEKILQSKSTLVLSTESELFKYLTDYKIKGQ